MFTNKQINEIIEKISKIGIKDTDLENASELNGSEVISIVQNNVQKKATLSDVFNYDEIEYVKSAIKNAFDIDDEDVITDQLNIGMYDDDTKIGISINVNGSNKILGTIGIGNFITALSNNSTTSAPTQKSVNDALALKANTSTVNEQLGHKVDKISGKGLSTNDYTNADKSKVSQIQNKLNKPSVQGTEGQVLSLNEYLEPIWKDEESIPDGIVRYDIDQDLRDTEKSRVQHNIGVADEINSLMADIYDINQVIPSSATSNNKLTDKEYVDAIGGRVSTIENKIPNAATSLNKLADKEFVNSSIATNTATFRGTFNPYTDDIAIDEISDSEWQMGNDTITRPYVGNEYVFSQLFSRVEILSATREHEDPDDEDSPYKVTIEIEYIDADTGDDTQTTFTLREGQSSTKSEVFKLIGIDDNAYHKKIQFVLDNIMFGIVKINEIKIDSTDQFNIPFGPNDINWNKEYDDRESFIAENNDYIFLVSKDLQNNTLYERFKYSVDLDPENWQFEYALNNSSFTAAQWAAINSGLVAADKTKIDSALIDVKVDGVSVVSGGVANIADKVFLAVVSTTSFADIKTAYDAKKVVIAMHSSGGIYLLASANSSIIMFYNANGNGTRYLVYPNNSWTYNATETKELTSNKVTTIDANSDNNHYPGAKAVFDLGYVEGVISQTQTWAADNTTYTLANIVRGNVQKSFISDWEMASNAQGGTFNTATGYFELNGITDLSYQDAQRIMILGNPCLKVFSPNGSTAANARTILFSYSNESIGWNKSLEIGVGDADPYIESIVVANSYASRPYIKVTSTYYWRRARHLKTIKYIDLTADTNAKTFDQCYRLEDCWVKFSANASFPDSSLMTAVSVAFMVNNGGTANRTITLHATAYARAIADDDVQAALTAHPNVTLASA